ncbi:tetratricopeptide repeat protein 38-like [Ostrea edulis]|uniref:tetratricopeptide repeat protein 38-like n=1 Tax=Ostrea edulis TaxID=37623 RepID=UPI002096392E|nr:tetratricopeptide repeat protein 38-like [Ostrea edulis]
MRDNWRDCQAWKEFGVDLSTTNNEAAKLFDAVLTQYVGWYDDNSLGGLENSVEKMIATDPKFVMGHVIKNGLDALGTGRSYYLDKEFQTEIQTMIDLGNSPSTLPREKQHINAVKLWSQGEMTDACQIWESILVENPLDMLALKFSHDSYFYQGHHPQMRDSIARAMPHWKSSMPLYSYLFGMHAFGLEECNHYDEAERLAAKGLELNRNDCWSTHSMAHVLEMTGRSTEGIKFMSTTENDWNVCAMLACHNYWHYGVFSIERGLYDEAVGLFDTQVGPRAVKSGAMLDMVDACSLLYRLKLEGINVKDKWKEFNEVCKHHADDHILTFNDAHFLMASLGAEDKATTDKMMMSLKEFAKGTGKGDNQRISKEVGVPLCEALVAYDSGDFAKAVSLVNPIRYKILTIGGSHAQRDVFNQFLIHAALQSPEKAHNKLARVLLTERKTLKSNAPLTDRLITRAMAVHTAD